MRLPPTRGVTPSRRQGRRGIPPRRSHSCRAVHSLGSTPAAARPPASLEPARGSESSCPGGSRRRPKGRCVVLPPGVPASPRPPTPPPFGRSRASRLCKRSECVERFIVDGIRLASTPHRWRAGARRTWRCSSASQAFQLPYGFDVERVGRLDGDGGHIAIVRPYHIHIQGFSMGLPAHSSSNRRSLVRCRHALQCVAHQRLCPHRAVDRRRHGEEAVDHALAVPVLHLHPRRAEPPRVRLASSWSTSHCAVSTSAGATPERMMGLPVFSLPRERGRG